MRGTVVMANASPKMMSERDSILSREIPTPEALFFSTKVRPSLVGSGHLRSCLPNENPNVLRSRPCSRLVMKLLGRHLSE